MKVHKICYQKQSNPKFGPSPPPYRLNGRVPWDLVKFQYLTLSRKLGKSKKLNSRSSSWAKTWLKPSSRAPPQSQGPNFWFFDFLDFYRPWYTQKKLKMAFLRLSGPIKVRKIKKSKICCMRLWRAMGWRSGPIFGHRYWSGEKLFQFLTIFGKSRLKFGKCMENVDFRDTQRAISWQRSIFFKFRKKRLIRLTELFHMRFTWFFDPGPPPLSP